MLWGGTQTILSYPENPRAWKAIIAGKYNGVDVEYPAFNFGVDNKTPEFLKLNPTGKVPVLITPEGPIFESNAIARYVARQGTNSLYGASEYEAVSVSLLVLCRRVRMHTTTTRRPST